ncbi:type II secretion system minor pseudopilin GspI [Sphingomonas sp. SORGH_AS_0879]|uniref:type II secretion system minor pseudopilin GspI n=1 Tax=Sphingomonas sp. SORGH_AS_0879 TaxID=3041790 RepID=UPI002786C731|nr:general secretion pathway protein I [Sphingomonas sp. SORGH_AS_0879]
MPHRATLAGIPLHHPSDGPPPRAGEDGFTLIEIMVALAVFSLAAMALVRLESATIRGAAILDETVVAQMVARNVAIAAVTDPQAPALGRMSGTEVNGGRSWKWTRIVSGTGDVRVVRIDVAVANAGGRIAGRMTMVRPPMPAPPVGVSAS